jgi:hypothetical protein
MSETTNHWTPDEAVQYVRAMRDRIPDFTFLEAEEKRKLSRAANIGLSLVNSATNAIDGSAALRGAFGKEAPPLRAEIESIVRWQQVLAELDAVRDGIRGAMTVRRHRVGGVALQVYQVSLQLTRYKENPELLPHIETMKRAAAAAFRQRRVGDAQQPPGTPKLPQPVTQPTKT